jgi:hypothetical protein
VGPTAGSPALRLRGADLEFKVFFGVGSLIDFRTPIEVAWWYFFSFGDQYEQRSF